MKLTAQFVRDARPEVGATKPKTYGDDKTPGLMLRVFPTGGKRFVLDYRIEGRQRRTTLGAWPKMSLADARAKAMATLAEIHGGKDPLGHRNPKPATEKADPTVADGLDRFFAEFVPARIQAGRMSPRTAGEYRRQAALFRPIIGDILIAEVRRDDIERAIAPRAPIQRNRHLALLSRLFAQFERWELRPQRSNPTFGIDKVREEPRDRTLSDDELAALAAALRDMRDRHPVPVAVLLVAMFSGLRISEILNMRWEHVDLDSGRIVLPKTKSGRRHHDLPSAALAEIDALPRFSTWIFMTRNGAGGATYSHIRKRFKDACAAAGVADVRIHDLRRSAMTRAAAAGVPTHVLRDLMGHKTTAMADRYVRHVGTPVREAREALGNQIAAIAEGK